VTLSHTIRYHILIIHSLSYISNERECNIRSAYVWNIHHAMRYRISIIHSLSYFNNDKRCNIRSSLLYVTVSIRYISISFSREKLFGYCRNGMVLRHKSNKKICNNPQYINNSPWLYLKLNVIVLELQLILVYSLYIMFFIHK